jgi:alkylation response protein AidB-like acyl-CoA dehydrogenase
MDFRLTEDQLALQQGVRDFCDGRVPLEQLAELEQKQAFDKGLWSELAEMGVFSLRLPEEQDGVGLGNADAVLVFAELGRRLVPGPTLWSHLAAGLVDGAASGEIVVGGLDAASAGEPALIEHFEHLDALLVLREDGVYRVAPGNVQVEPIQVPLDPLTPLHHALQVPTGEQVADAERAQMLRREGAVFAAAQMLGIAESTLQLANDYAKTRQQFDRPIAGFQAIKHILSDCFVRQEVARAAVYAAGATLDDPEVGDLDRAVSAAKLMAGVGALRNSRACIQVHGGMGYTWEVPAHYYLKRTWVLETLFGSSEEHEERIADRLDATAE